ncbi:rho guanine nucleotide exchange factor 26-like [Zophobas morio]
MKDIPETLDLKTSLRYENGRLHNANSVGELAFDKTIYKWFLPVVYFSELVMKENRKNSIFSSSFTFTFAYGENSTFNFTVDKKSDNLNAAFYDCFTEQYFKEARKTYSPPSTSNMLGQVNSSKVNFTDKLTSDALPSVPLQLPASFNNELQESLITKLRKSKSTISFEQVDILEFASPLEKSAEVQPEPAPQKKILNSLQLTLWKYQGGVDEDLVNSLSSEELKRQECLYEIVFSEEQYIKKLELVLRVYEKPLKKLNIIPREDMASILGDLGFIYTINKDLLEQLKVRQKEQWPLVQDVTDILIPFLKQLAKNYSCHCGKIKRANENCVRLSQTNIEFNRFLNTITIQKDVDSLGLQSYVILPLQRVTKYALLLRELLKYTSSDHPSFDNVKKALELAEEGLTIINENTREAENYEKLIHIQMSLEVSATFPPPSIVKNGRLYLYENYLDIQLLTKGKNRKMSTYTFLFNDVLLITKPFKPKRSSTEYTKTSHKNVSFTRRPVIQLESKEVNECQFYMYRPLFPLISTLEISFIGTYQYSINLEHDDKFDKILICAEDEDTCNKNWVSYLKQFVNITDGETKNSASDEN